MAKLKITTTTASEESVNRLYEVLKAGRCGAIPIEIDGNITSGIIMLKEDLTKLDMLHYAEVLDADKQGNAILFPIHIREAIGKMINPWSKIALWVQKSESTRQNVWTGVAKDLPKEYRECHITEFLPAKPTVQDALHLAIDLG